MSLSQPQNQIITWFVLFHIASNAALLQLLQRDLLRLSHRGLTYDCLDWSKITSCGSEVAKKGISCHDASVDSCTWNVLGTCCRGKEDCRHASVHGVRDFLYFWKPHTSWAFTMHEYLPGSRLLLCANNLLHVSYLNCCHLLLIQTLVHLKVQF